MTQNRRRNYFIDKSFQAKFILKFCALNILASLLTVALIYFLNRQTKTVTFEGLELLVKSTADFILPLLLQCVAIVALFIGVATIVVILVTSHKIAGPLYRLTIELKKIKAGDLSAPIHIRTEDQLQKVAEEFEEMRVAFRGSLDSLRKNWTALRPEILSFKNAVRDESQKKRLEKEIGVIDAELARFKTE